MNKKVSKGFIEFTMGQARDLQSRYDFIGAPGTQSIRNPLPMKVLVACTLPSLPGPETKLRVTRGTYLTKDGKSFYQGLPNDSIPASEVLPSTYWEKNAISVQEIEAKLLADGYIVKAGRVGSALTILSHETGLVGKMKFNHRVRGVSYNRYFLVKS